MLNKWWNFKISLKILYARVWRNFGIYEWTMLVSALRVPGGNPVDGLPPARHTGAIGILENFESFKFKKKPWKYREMLQIWALSKTLASDGNLNSIAIWCSYSAKIKLQYMKSISNVADFHINVVLSTRNMFKQVKVINKLGRFGTGFPIAPVLLFELLPSDKL